MKYIKLISIISIIILLSLNILLSQDNLLTIYNCHPKGYGKIAFDDYKNLYPIYSAYFVKGQHFDTLWVTSSKNLKYKSNTAEKSELYYSIRPATKRTDCFSKGWSKLKILKSDDVYNRFNRGTFAHWNNKIITSTEIPIVNSVNNEIQGSSFNFNLVLISKNSQGHYLVDINPEIFKFINNSDFWNSQPAVSIDKKRLFFVSNRPLPDRPKSTDLNIWYSDFNGTEFTKPKPAIEINTIYDEMSPHCSVDGKFYYASNMKRNNVNTVDYDIYVAELINGLPDNPENINKIYEKNECINDTRYMINTTDNEIFPFITPDTSSILYSSDKTNDSGIYSIFAAKMQPPCIKFNVNTTHKLKDIGNKLLSSKSNNYNNMQLLLNNEISFTPLDTLILDPKTEYTVSYSFDSIDCYNCIALPKQIKFVTPNHDDSIQKEIEYNCVKDYEPRPVISKIYALPFFIDGYWKPSTSKYMKEYINRVDKDMLDSSMMYDVITSNYGLITDEIDNVIENKIVNDIVQLLPELKRCWDTLTIKIDILAFSDTCTSSSTFCCEGDMKIKDYIINDSMDLSKRFVRDSQGQMVKFSKNQLLNTLRAHYSYLEISKSFEENIPNYQELLKDRLITLEYEGKSVYPSNCNQLNDIIKTFPIMPEKLDSCSNPLHNVVFIYLNIIGRDDKNYHIIDECGNASEQYYEHIKKSKFEYIDIKKENK